MSSSAWKTSSVPFLTRKILMEELGVSEIMATILAQRGYSDVEAARRFLSPSELHDPSLFPDMKAVTDRIQRAIHGQERIIIHGDYDVDGVTSTALLTTVLRGMGADVGFVLPDRFRGGYGITSECVQAIAAEASLLITVDCGITARDEIELGRNLGLDVIVIDHHKPVADSIPSALCICPSLCEYPFKELAGVGLAFKVAQALLPQGFQGEGSSLSPELTRHLDLVALGTIADVVPLVGENRFLVKRGLIEMSKTLKPGLKALMKVAHVDPRGVNTGKVAFRLAPRINAAGRLESAESALRLLMSESQKEADELALHLDSLNQKRQQIETEIIDQADATITSWPPEVRDAFIYVLDAEGWHEGVMGIAASRLTERYRRPVIVIATKDGVGKGSGRSIPGFNLHEALLQQRYLLQRFGGHSAACGLTISVDDIPAFRDGITSYAQHILSEEDLQRPKRVDAIAAGCDLTLELTAELSQLEPFGMGNPSIKLVSPSSQIHNGRLTRDGRHFQCELSSGGVRSGAIAFQQAKMADKLQNQSLWDVIFRLEENEFNGCVSPQVMVQDFMLHEVAQVGNCSCDGKCTLECQDRLRGQDFWNLTGLQGNASHHGTDAEKDVFFPEKRLDNPIEPEALIGESFLDSDRLIDRRGKGGVLGSLARLLATGERVLVLTADIPRRRDLISKYMPVSNLGIEEVSFIGGRCSPGVIETCLHRVGERVSALVMADFYSALSIGDQALYFEHVVFLDPPPHYAFFTAIMSAIPQAWVHLFYSGDEVQFTGKVLEQEYDLRSSLAKVYRLLKTETAHPLNEATEWLLIAGQKYLRQPYRVAKCLRILQELNLLSVEEREALPILTLLEGGKTDLNLSPTFRAVTNFYEECQQFLSNSLHRNLTSPLVTTTCRSYSTQ